jgi:uncharacterized protein YcbX
MEVNDVWRYPVKSMLGERRESVDVTAQGIVGDRSWAIIDRADGKVASAKNPRKWRALLECRAEFLEQPQRLSDRPPVRITLPDGRTTASDAPDIDAVLTVFLGRDVTLASSAPDASTYEATWPDVDGMAPTEFIESTQTRVDAGEPVSDLPLAFAAPPGSFFDLAPLHVVTTSSLERLRDLQPAADFSVQRFRPNFIIDGAGDGFAENEWVGANLQVGPTAMINVMMPTMRCVMTTLAQDALPEDRGVLRTVAVHNRVEISGLGTWACVGAYADVVEPGNVSVGDRVTLSIADSS